MNAKPSSQQLVSSHIPYALAFVRAMVLVSGLVYTLSGAALIFLPDMFYNNIGYFPPFNRHYMGDAGTFTLPLGIALLFAFRHPERHHLIIAAGMAVNLLHALNHLYDDVLVHQWDVLHWSGTTWSLLLIGVMGIVALALVWRGSAEA